MKGSVTFRVAVGPWFFQWLAVRAAREHKKDEAFVRFMLFVATEERQR